MNALIIAYYVLAGLSVLCSIFVILTLAFYGSLKTSATRLLMALHFTLIWEEVTALPYVYNTNNALCEAVAFLHYYFGEQRTASIQNIYQPLGSFQSSLLSKYLSFRF